MRATVNRHKNARKVRTVITLSYIGIRRRMVRLGDVNP
jgi:hypothetical protein